jgi:hypothetical protein
MGRIAREGRRKLTGMIKQMNNLCLLSIQMEMRSTHLWEFDRIEIITNEDESETAMRALGLNEK